MAEIDNLKIQESITKTIRDRQAVLSAQTREMNSQLQVALQLKAVMDGLSADDLTKRLDEAQKALDAIGQNAQNLNNVSSQAMSSISKGAAKASDQTSKLEKSTRLLLQKYPSLKSVGTAALSGLSQGFTNLLSLSRGVAGVVEGLVSGMFNLGKAILSIPLRIFQGLLDSAASFTGDTSLMQAFENLRKEFGSFKEDVSKNVITSFHEIQKGLTGTGLSAFRVFGQYADQLKYFTEEAQKAGAQIHNFGTEMAKTAGAFAAFEKGLAIGDNLKAMMDRATVTGTKLGEQFRLTANYSLQMGKDFGISQKVLAKDIGSMMKDVKNFGSLTQKEMSIAAVYTRKLGVEVQNLLGLVDKFDTFEDAANSAAQLNQAFGASVDAFKMMQEQDPAKRLDMLRKSMAAAGKTTENMSRQELKLLAQTSGLDEATAKLAFSAKNQGLSYDEVKKKAEKAEKSQLTQAQALSKLADSIERFIMQGQQLHGSFFKMFIDGFERGVKNSKPFMDLMINLRQALYDTMFAGMKVGKEFVKFFPGITQSLENLAKMFAPGRFHKLLGGVVDSFVSFFKEMDTGKFSLKNLLENLQKNFLNWFDMNSQEGKGLLDGTKKTFQAFAGIIGQGARFVVEKLTDGISSLADFIKDPSAFLSKLKGKGKGALGLFSPFIDALNDPKLWQNLWGATKKLFTVVFDKMKSFFMGPEFASIVKDWWPVIATVLFGPALTRMLAASFIQLLLKTFSSSASSVTNVIKGGLGGVTKAIENTAGTKKGATQLSEKNIPNDKTMSGIGSMVSSIAKMKTKDIIEAGVKGVILAAFISGAMVEMMVAIGLGAKALQSMKVEQKSLLMAIETMVGVSVALVPLMLAVKIASKAGNIGEMIPGLLSIGIVVGAMAGALMLIQKGFNALKLSPNDSSTIAVSMLAMSGVFLAASAIVPIATAIGSLMTGPLALLAVAGLGAITVVVAAMATSVIGIMKSLDQVPFSEGINEKVKAFASVMTAVGGFAGNMAQVIEASRPSFVELLTGRGNTEKNLDGMKDFVFGFVNRIQGLFDVIKGSISTLSMSPEMLKAAELFANVLQSVSTMATAMTPPTGTKSSLDSVLNVIRGESSDTQLVDLTNYVKRFTGSIGDFMGIVKGTISQLTSLNVTEEGLRGIKAFGDVTNAMVSVIKAVTPSPELVEAMKTGVNNEALKGVLSSLDSQSLGDMSRYVRVMLEQTSSLVTVLAGTVVQKVMQEASRLNVKDFSKIKVITDIIGTVGGFLGSITQATMLANTSQTEQTKDAVTTIQKVFPSITSVFGALTDSLPKVIDAVQSAIFTLPEAGKLSTYVAKVDALKKTLDIVTQLSNVIHGFSGGPTGNSDTIVSSVASVALAVSRLFFGGGAFGTATSPMTELINNVKFIADNASQFTLNANQLKVADVLKGTADNVVSISSSLKQFENAAKSIQTISIGDVLPKDITKAFAPGQVSPYIQGLNQFAIELTTMNGSVKSGTVQQAVKVTQDIIDSVNELNKVLGSGDGTNVQLSTRLKAFAQTANLRGADKMTIENKGVTVNVTMQVTMDAADLEESIIFRKSSVIREGIKDSNGYDHDEVTKHKLNNF